MEQDGTFSSTTRSDRDKMFDELFDLMSREIDQVLSQKSQVWKLISESEIPSFPTEKTLSEIEHQHLRAKEIRWETIDGVDSLVIPAGNDLPYKFLAVIEEAASLHKKKNADYGQGEDCYANVRNSERYGIPAWVGALVRMEDKAIRLQSFLEKGELKNESVRDSLIDRVVYAIICLLLWDEADLYWED